MSERELVAALGLQPHPEGGWWAQTWLGAAGTDGRPCGTAILYLLGADDVSRWHRVDVDEVWHHHRGAPVRLRLWAGHGAVSERVLDADCPQVVVPGGSWQTARPVGGFALVGCTMAPGFFGEDFAPDGWEPDA